MAQNISLAGPFVRPANRAAHVLRPTISERRPKLILHTKIDISRLISNKSEQETNSPAQILLVNCQWKCSSTVLHQIGERRRKAWPKSCVTGGVAENAA